MATKTSPSRRSSRPSKTSTVRGRSRRRRKAPAKPPKTSVRQILSPHARDASGILLVVVAVAGLAEIPAILGLVLFMVSGLRADFYALLTLSLALLATWFPRLESWREWAAEPPARG